MSVLRANLAGIPLFLVMSAAVVLPSAAIWGLPEFLAGMRGFTRPEVLVPLLAAGTAAHEFLHGLGWVRASGGSMRSVRFGFHWKTLTPYAHYTEPIAASAYRFGIALPGIAVGLLPAAVGYAAGSPAAILFGGLFTGAAAGDVLGLWAIRRIPATTLVRDHPTRVGCQIVESEPMPSTT